jgi:hypothetical protein
MEDETDVILKKEGTKRPIQFNSIQFNSIQFLKQISEDSNETAASWHALTILQLLL